MSHSLIVLTPPMALYCSQPIVLGQLSADPSLGSQSCDFPTVSPLTQSVSQASVFASYQCPSLIRRYLLSPSDNNPLSQKCLSAHCEGWVS
jgi:hypothetical protein